MSLCHENATIWKIEQNNVLPINCDDVEFRGIFCELFEDWNQIFTVTTPWSVEHT